MPAGSLEVLKTAVVYGADAVYIGGEVFSLRAKARNFSAGEMAEGIAFAHARGVRVYVTVNIFARNEDLEEAAAYIGMLRDMKPEPCDALILSDPGIFSVVKRVWPEAEIHISTQANSTNYETYRFWWELGVRRVVAARELSLGEIREIRERIPEGMEVECFVHGAMCISYSGRCLLSNYFTGRDANRGACTHPCRWKYAVSEETRPGEYLPVYENDRGTYLLNSRDLCMVEHIPALLEAGIDSFKVEGRMKTALYVACIARAYRKAIDDCLASEELYRSRMDWYLSEVSMSANRRYTTGFYFGPAGRDAQIYEDSAYVKDAVYLGIVEETACRDSLFGPGETSQGTSGKTPEGTSGETPEGTSEKTPEGTSGETSEGTSEKTSEETSGETPGAAARGNRLLAKIRQRNKFSVGDVVQIMRPDGGDQDVAVLAMYDENGEPVESCPHPKQVIWLELSGEAAPYDLLRLSL